VNSQDASSPADVLRGPARRGPRLLVSVRSVEEAQSVLRGGADWIDLKEPRRGPLGAVDAATARQVAACGKGAAPLSAAAGELLDWSGGAARELLAVDGVSLLKLGLSGCRGIEWAPLWRQAQQEIADGGREMVAVIYADAELARSPSAGEIIDVAAAAACRWLLIDTFDKVGGALHDSIDNAALRDLLSSARSAGMDTVVAGSLNADSIAKLPMQLIDMVAVRGAVCPRGRSGVVSSERVTKLRALITALAGRQGLAIGVFPQPRTFA